VKRKKTPIALATDSPPACLEEVKVVPVTELEHQHHFQSLLKKHHYLGSLKPVGERMFYAAVDARGRWLALLLFSAPAKYLKHRDAWIGWTRAQCDRRLPLVVNNTRFLILPQAHLPNLGSRVLRLTLDRLSADWQARYAHPVLVVETFVDPEQFQGTVYTAQGWQELGLTDGFGRHRRDYYVQHDKPKRLFVREVVKNARRSLQAEHLKPALAGVEKKAGGRSYHKCAELRALTEHFKQLPEYRGRVESYPVWSLVTLMLVAMLCDAPRGQKDLAKLARRLTQHQRRALGIRPNPQGFFPAPSQSTFSRLLAKLDAAPLNQTLLEIQTQVRGQAPPKELIVIDGKEPNHGPGESILSAVSVPSQFYLGSALVDTKTNEIPVARQLFNQLDLAGRTVELDALHTQDQTARELVLDHGAHYLFTVKDNQPTLRRNIDQMVPTPPVGFSPSAHDPHSGAHRGEKQGGAREPHPGEPSGGR
jgi:predicted transposase YbfD/YdcC